MAELQDAVAIVTGAGRGIGRAIAEELGRGGATVVANYAQSKGHAEEVVERLRAHGSPRSVAIKADVSDAQQAAGLVAETVSRFGRLDILVNNAGITRDRTMRKLTVEDWDAVVQVDLSSCFYTVKAALPHFIDQKYGRVINISSFVAQAGNFGQTNYAAAKAGIIGFTKSAAIELARYNVTVNAICPGFVDTEMYHVVPDNIKELILDRIPMGRVAKPREIARCVTFLIVDGDYITGETISINGGLYMD